MTGTVNTYDPLRLFGFITGDDGRRYFVHKSAVTGPMLEWGERVEFEPVAAVKGPRAEQVRRLAVEADPPPVAETVVSHRRLEQFASRFAKGQEG